MLYGDSAESGRSSIEPFGPGRDNLATTKHAVGPTSAGEGRVGTPEAARHGVLPQRQAAYEAASGSFHPGEPVRAPAATRSPMKFRCASTVPAPKHRPRMSR